MDKETFKALSVHNKKYKSIVILCKVSLKREFICVLLYKQEKKKKATVREVIIKPGSVALFSCSVQGTALPVVKCVADSFPIVFS